MLKRNNNGKRGCSRRAISLDSLSQQRMSSKRIESAKVDNLTMWTVVFQQQPSFTRCIWELLWCNAFSSSRFLRSRQLWCCNSDPWVAIYHELHIEITRMSLDINRPATGWKICAKQAESQRTYYERSWMVQSIFATFRLPVLSVPKTWPPIKFLLRQSQLEVLFGLKCQGIYSVCLTGNSFKYLWCNRALQGLPALVAIIYLFKSPEMHDSCRDIVR